MKRIKSAVCLQIGITLAAVLLLSACAEKRAPQPSPPDDAVYIAESKVAELKITAPAELGFMVKGACAGAACGLLAQVEPKPAPAAAQCSFPADKYTPEPAIDRQAGASPAVSDSDNVDDVKREEKEVAPPVGAYQQPARRAIPEYRRNSK